MLISGIFELKLLREHEVAFQFLMCFFEEVSQFRAECSNIIEGVKIIDNKWSNCLHTLQLLFTKVEAARATEFMHHSGNDGLWVDIRQEDQRRIHAGVKGVRFILASLPPLLVVILFLA